jgi:peptidoglycan hydrolase-like protein with peptidoglycan-binding domain
MTLQELVDTNGSEELNELSQKPDLAKEIQTRLGELGILDPPTDGKFGPQSQNALRLFAKRVGVELADYVKADLASELLAAEVESLYPITPETDLAGKIFSYMQLKNYWFARPAGYLNIVYVEGMDGNGELNANQPNQFNDRRLIISIEDEKPKIIGSWEATTEPGKYYTEQPPVHGGVARIALDQFKSWHVGIHTGLSGSDDQEALVQFEDISIFRDLNKDYQRAGDLKYTGYFAINQHHGHDRPLSDIGKVSAGCLVGRTKAGHQQFMQLIKSDPRYIVHNGYRFMTTVISGQDLLA